MEVIKKVRPLFTSVFVTMDMYDDVDLESVDFVGDDVSRGGLKPYQRVLSVGSMVRNVKEGDIVAIRPDRYAVRKHQEGSLKDGVIEDNVVVGFNFRVIDTSEGPVLHLQESDIDYVIEEFE